MMHVCICMYVCNVCVRAYIYIYIYIYIHIQAGKIWTEDLDNTMSTGRVKG